MQTTPNEPTRQLLLFRPSFGTGKPAEPIPPHQAGSATSREAAIRAVPRQPGRRARVMEYVAAQGSLGATRDELSVALDAPVQCLCSAVRQLLDSGDIVETKQTRLTRLGSPAAVLIARRGAEGKL